jgi:hypothetical protein
MVQSLRLSGMTNTFHIRAVPGAPVACDMSTARDTPDERLAAYVRLFEHALVRRERRADTVVFWFRADPGTPDAVQELARREAACCPFLDFRVETAEDEVIWTITNAVTGDERASVDVVLEALHALPDHASSNVDGLFDRLADRGVHVIAAGGERP